MFKRLRNYVTTIVGLFTGVVVLIPQIEDAWQAVAGVIAAIALLFAKDK